MVVNKKVVMKGKVKNEKHQRMKTWINFDQQAARKAGGGATSQKDFQRTADRMAWTK